jgi:hypothetical protein
MILVILACLFTVACVTPANPVQPLPPPVEEVPAVVEGQPYLKAEEVALYLHMFGTLPSNFLSKSQAERLGWVPSKGNLWDVAPGAAIGGDRFGNREGLLPDKSGRGYFECDVNYEGGFRGPERLVYSSDGLVFYTADHYESFTLLYGEVND